MNYFLLSGFKGSGKDTFADILLEEVRELGVIANKYSLAAKLKTACSEMAGLSETYAYDEILKEEVLDKRIQFSMNDLNSVLDKFDVSLPYELKESLVYPAGFETMRRCLQYVGTDVLRHASASIHCEVTEKEILLSSNELAVISDCRFFNETDYFKSLTMFVHRKSKMPENTPDLHRSEKEMFKLMEALPIIDNNSTLENLREKAKRLAAVLKNNLK